MFDTDKTIIYRREEFKVPMAAANARAVVAISHFSVEACKVVVTNILENHNNRVFTAEALANAYGGKLVQSMRGEQIPEECTLLVGEPSLILRAQPSNHLKEALVVCRYGMPEFLIEQSNRLGVPVHYLFSPPETGPIAFNYELLPSIEVMFIPGENAIYARTPYMLESAPRVKEVHRDGRRFVKTRCSGYMHNNKLYLGKAV